MELLASKVEDNIVPSHSNVEGVTTRTKVRRAKWSEVPSPKYLGEEIVSSIQKCIAVKKTVIELTNLLRRIWFSNADASLDQFIMEGKDVPHYIAANDEVFSLAA